MKMKNLKQKNLLWALPNILTYLRILIIPVIFYMLYSKNEIFSNYIACSLFVLASITDYLDGYLSRKMKLTSEIGRFLDPIADKVLVASALILVAAHYDELQIYVIIASLIIIARELIISCFRIYWEHARCFANTDNKITSQKFMNIYGKCSNVIDICNVVFFVQNRLIQVRNAPSKRNIKV